MKNLIIIILIITFLIIIVLGIYLKSNKKQKPEVNLKINNLVPIENIINIFESKPILWCYWEGEMPDYIKMCKETIYKHCSKSFDIIVLNDKNIHIHLPELKEKQLDFSNLKIAQKVDYYRILLLYKYGGLYLDMDILVQKDLKEIMDKLKKYDFVGFGCTGARCKYGYGKPSNWLLASRKNTLLMKNILENYENKLKELNLNKSSQTGYFDFGKYIIWEELEKLIKNGYSYYHYPNTVDGTRDINGNWVTMGRLFSDKYIEYDNPDNLLMVVLYNSDLDDFDKKYRNMSKEELLKTNINFIRYYNKSKLNEFLCEPFT